MAGYPKEMQVHRPAGPEPRQLRVVGTKHTCRVCDIRRLLLNAGDELLAEADSVRCRGPYFAGDRIYTTGSRFESVYAVTHGSVKTEVNTEDGTLKVTDFYLRGELFGTDALGEEFHVTDAIATERTWVCELPTTVLETLCRHHPDVLRTLFRLLGRRHRETHLSLVRAPGRIGEQRVLSFFQEIARRTRYRTHCAGNAIPLPMSKADIASYLGMSPETLSRILRRLSEAELLSCGPKSFCIGRDTESACS